MLEYICYFPDNYRPNRRPEFNQRPPSWSNNSNLGSKPVSWSQNREREPSSQVSAASASSGSTSNSAHGFSTGHSSSQSGWGPHGLSSSSNNRVQSSGNAQSSAQGAAAAVGQNPHGKTEASFSSGAISSTSVDNGQFQGSSVSENRGQNSRGEVTSQGFGVGNIAGTANAGTVSVVRFPEDERSQNIPPEFIRQNPWNGNNEQGRKSRTKPRNPIDRFFSEITDTVVDLFDI